MAKTLTDRKTATMERLMAIDTARRGQLSQQYYTRTTANGQTVRQGPYYVWQRYVDGKKRSARISPDQIARVEAELKRGSEVDSLLEELWSILEEGAQERDSDSKKKPMRSKRPASARPKPRSN
jgi:hypothetical protein